MEILVILLMIFIGLNFLMKLSFWEKWWMPVIASLICAGFLIFVLPYSIEQSKTQIEDFLNNTSRMLDVSVLLTLEATLAIAYCFISLIRYQKKRQRMGQRILHYFAGISIFIVLFYLQTQLIFTFPGVSFTTISRIAAITIAVLIPLFCWLIRLILPEKELRMELYFFGNLCLIGLTVVCTVNGHVAVDGGQQIDWLSTLGTLGIIMGGAAIGYIIFRLKLKKWAGKE